MTRLHHFWWTALLLAIDIAMAQDTDLTRSATSSQISQETRLSTVSSSASAIVTSISNPDILQGCGPSAKVRRQDWPVGNCPVRHRTRGLLDENTAIERRALSITTKPTTTTGFVTSMTTASSTITTCPQSTMFGREFVDISAELGTLIINEDRSGNVVSTATQLDCSPNWPHWSKWPTETITSSAAIEFATAIVGCPFDIPCAGDQPVTHRTRAAFAVVTRFVQEDVTSTTTSNADSGPTDAVVQARGVRRRLA